MDKRLNTESIKEYPQRYIVSVKLIPYAKGDNRITIIIHIYFIIEITDM